MALTASAPSPPLLKVAVIGSGPAGFYACEALLKQTELPTEIHLYERLPTPYGLVRGGVAPDHQHIKAVTRLFERTARRDRFQFFGNVTFGTDFSLTEALTHYHQVLICCGAEKDKALHIRGETLPGSHSATAFVGWYNGHPDFIDFPFNPQIRDVVVIGNGNVAIDVTRILAKPWQALAETDIADPALLALKHSTIRDIYLIGRRGPLQTSFSNPELKALTTLEQVQLCLRAQDLQLDPLSKRFAEEHRNPNAQRNLALLQTQLAESAASSAHTRRIHLHFFSAPHAILGTDRVEGVRVEQTVLEAAGDQLRAVGSGIYHTLPAQLVLRSVGYRSTALPGIPFDNTQGIIPHCEGRVLKSEHDSTPLPRVYVAGWIKRGPSGVIGTNKADANQTVRAMLADAPLLLHAQPVLQPALDLHQKMEARGIKLVSFDDWQRLNAIEKNAGAAEQRPRKKMLRIPEMLAALD